MFNLFWQEKLDKEKKEQKKLQNISKKEINTRKLENLNMIDKYNNRVRVFTYEMIDKPIYINDLGSPVENTRKAFLEEENSKIKGKKGFVFSSYITEKERLSAMEFERMKEQQRVIRLTAKKHNIDEKILLGLIQQPQMRYKPRTDIERIVDTLSANNLILGSERKVLNKQLKTMNIGVPFKITAESLSNPYLRQNIQGKNPLLNLNTTTAAYAANLESYLDTLVLQGKGNIPSDKKLSSTNLHTDFASVKKQSILETRERAKKRFNNKDAKKILKHLHQKTHFKASTSLIFDKNLNIPNEYQSIIQQFNNAKSQGNISPKTSIYEYSEQLKKKKQVSDLIKPQYKEDMFFPVSQNNFYKQDNDEVDFKLNYNPLIKFEENVVDYNKLRKAKNIFTKEENEEDGEKKASKYPNLVKRLIKNSKAKRGKSFKLYNTNDTNIDEMKKEDDKVIIDKETINKNETDKIAMKILYKCNYFHKKNKNNDVIHEARKGKTMVTNGMSVKEFEKEYGLEFINYNKNKKGFNFLNSNN